MAEPSPVRQEHGFRRTECACALCQAPCRHVPGSLDPADLSRLCPAGQDVLVRAFVEIAGRHPGLRLQLVGPDRWPGKVKFAQLLPQWVPDESVRTRIELRGPVPLGDVMGILRGASVAVIASRGFESFSYAASSRMKARTSPASPGRARRMLSDI